MKFLVLPDYSNETTAQYFPVLLIIYIALSRTTASLRASFPFGEVERGHAREARERRHDCEGRGVFLNVRQAFMAGQPGISSIQIIWRCIIFQPMVFCFVKKKKLYLFTFTINKLQIQTTCKIVQLIVAGSMETCLLHYTGSVKRHVLSVHAHAQPRAKQKWKFIRDFCKLSFLPHLAASPLARAFSRGFASLAMHEDHASRLYTAKQTNWVTNMELSSGRTLVQICFGWPTWCTPRTNYSMSWRPHTDPWQQHHEAGEVCLGLHNNRTLLHENKFKVNRVN